MRSSFAWRTQAIEELNPSIRFLRAQCKKYFKPTTPHFFDFTSWPRAQTVDLVLIGLGPLTMLLKWIWPARMKFRIWVLCRAHRRVLVELMGFPEESIGVIPRYKLAPRLKAKAHRVLDLQQDFDLIYSGRIQSHKNFALACAVATALQHVTENRVRFYICGARLDQAKDTIKKELAQHRWKTQPTFLGDLGENWFKHRWKNPVLINLSTFCYEDFGVSVAQADRMGWPMILSEWGGHLDVQSPGAIFVPADLILESQRTKSKTKAAKQIAALCTSSRRALKSEARESTKGFENPKAIDRDTILKAVSEMNSKAKESVEKYFDLSTEHRFKKSNRWIRQLEKALSERFK